VPDIGNVSDTQWRVGDVESAYRPLNRLT
jgi:hypothetical protein